MPKQPTVLDLFCGCGGLSLGFMQAGYHVVAGIDVWPDAIKTFQYNHPHSTGIIADLSTLRPEQFSQDNQILSVDVIIGGPPCQGFSIAGKRIIDDERNHLYQSFVKFVSFYQPKFFMMENVPNIISMGNGAIKNQIIQDFEALGYRVDYKILLASDFGVPQNRKRAFFVGKKNPAPFTFPQSTIQTKVTCAEAISDLTENSLENGVTYPVLPQSAFQALMRQHSQGIYQHQITQHNEKTINTIALVPDGGNYKNLPIQLQDTRKVNIAWTRLNSQKPSFTIDTGHRHHFHYLFNRVPTVRESARIQSFPDHFHFLGSKTSQYKQVGNAVPPLLAQILAKTLLDNV